MDFTLKTYKRLLSAFIDSGYRFITLEEFFSGKEPLGKIVMLRHDVDRKPGYSLRMAQLEQSLGVRASYYFRVVPESYRPEIIQAIIQLGHEFGYHYEDLAMCGGDMERAIRMFRQNLENFRTFYPVKTACMHGNPMSKWDNRHLWNKYSYREEGIVGEPYYDIDYRGVLYLTDTGRRWDNQKMNLRDRVEDYFHLTFASSEGIAAAAEKGETPDRVLINTHPERWTDALIPWLLQWGVQNMKNVVKRLLVRRNAAGAHE